MADNAAILADAIDAWPVAVFVTDRDGRLVAANPAGCKLVGTPLDELLQRNAVEFALDPENGRALYDEIVREGETRGIVPLRQPDGSTLVVRYTARAIGDGSRFLTIVVPRRVIGADTSPQEDAARRPRSRDRSVLSAREFEILSLLAEGRENDEIGRALHLAPDTVKAHVSKILAKLGARSRTHAVSLGFRSGLLHLIG
jgi:PAS domain S-box-containing protein